MPHYTDTTDKIIKTYFQGITKKDFLYKNKIYEPKKLKTNYKLFRGYTCPPNCGACCPVFSLDYLPTEKRPEQCKERYITFNEKEYKIYSITQSDNKTKHCQFMSLVDGRCEIHGMQPFSCDFELLRFSLFQDGTARLITRQFGRGWALTRYDNVTKGAMCEITPIDKDSINDVLRKLNRLKQWAEYFKLGVTHIDTILQTIPEKILEMVAEK